MTTAYRLSPAAPVAQAIPATVPDYAPGLVRPCVNTWGHWAAHAACSSTPAELAYYQALARRAATLGRI